MKLFLLLLVLISSLFSKTYNFTETRYSDAFDSSLDLEGIISFKKNGLKINYENENREILYEDSLLIIKENEKVLDIDAMQIQSVSSFFEILFMIYNNDETILKENFILKNIGNRIELYPKNNLSQHIEIISVLKVKEQTKEVKLFLKNGDSITIRIDDEIR